MTDRAAARANWEESFAEQVARAGYNTAPVEAIVRHVAYFLRSRERPDTPPLRFLEVGCGAGPNLVWLARRGIRVSGIDISPTALGLARRALEEAGLASLVDHLVESPADRLPFADATFDGVIEACVLQHLARPEREAAFREIRRVLRPGGLFAGYLLSVDHTVYAARRADEDPADPGTLDLREGGSRMWLTNIGLTHFFRLEEFEHLLGGFSVIDPCACVYDLPRDEAARRGYPAYRQAMWALYAIR